MSYPIKFKHYGDFSKTNNFLQNAMRKMHIDIYSRYGKKGVEVLMAATPMDTGVTANSWSYEVTETEHSVTITWTNSSTTPDGIPIVILLQYGHATGSGGYVQGRDFINPAIQPIMDELAEKVCKEVVKS